MYAFKFCLGGSLIGLLLLLFSTFFAQVHGIILPRGNWYNVLDQFELFNPTRYLEAAFRIDTASMDFWESAIHLGDRVQNYTLELIHNAGASNATLAIQLDDFKDTMLELVSGVQALRAAVQSSAQAHATGISLEEISEKLSVELAVILEEFKREFPSPDKATHHKEREEMISRALSKVEDSLVRVLSFGMSEADTRAHFRVIKRHAQVLLVLTGDLAEQHPILLETLLFSGAIMCLPEMWLLRPFLGLFGFGPYGPVKGSAAAWAQRRFWGAAVAKGSWFAHLQSAAMKFKIPPGSGKKIIGGIGLGVGVVGSLLGCR